MSPQLSEVSCMDKSMTVFSSCRLPKRDGWGGGWWNQVLLDKVLEVCVHTGKHVICPCSLLVSGESAPGVLDTFHLLEPGLIITQMYLPVYHIVSLLDFMI